MIRFDHRVFIDLTLEDSPQYSLPGLKNKIDQMKYTGGATLTNRALKVVKEKIFNGIPRREVPRTCIVITDGKSYEGVDKVSNDLKVLYKHVIGSLCCKPAFKNFKGFKRKKMRKNARKREASLAWFLFNRPHYISMKHCFNFQKLG